ncbi:MAG: PorP/SprF family type IX secretion system membrane protein [Saprospiraceae bacterium]|nr:PorP/SprF family type IX secretion system membrane protein [Saprospiraceae bacterium]
MKKFVLSFLLLLSLLTGLRAQDQHFTQFYASPLMLNPGLTGGFEGRYRVGTIYRDQWRQVLDNPIRTFAVAADLRFDAPGKRVFDDAIGLGLMFFTDKVNVVDFSTTQIAISAAYHKSLGANNRQFLSLGIQGGLTQRNLNYESLEFQDEFDGQTGYVLPTGEVLPENNFAFPDLNVGLNYTARFGRTGAVFAGVALHHVLQPDVSFFSTGAPGEKLYRKLSAQASANIPIGKSKTSFLPRVNVAMQGPHMQINAGANFRTALGKYGTTALHLGGWLRPVRNDESFGLDAVVALVGVEFNNVLFGLSYDLNPGALAFGKRQGAFELSIAYLGEYQNEEILCPKF